MLAWVVHYWPSVVFLPTILLVVVLLAAITHQWDRRDEAARVVRPSQQP